MGQLSFFDLDERYQRFSPAGDPPAKLSMPIDTEIFRHRLVGPRPRAEGSTGGHPSYNPVLKFKVLIRQALYAQSNDTTEFQIQDRLSFIRFPWLGQGDAVPDANMNWLFCGQLARSSVVKGAITEFNGSAYRKGYLPTSGQIVAPPSSRSHARAIRTRRRLYPKIVASPRIGGRNQRSSGTRYCCTNRMLKRAKTREVKDDRPKMNVEIEIPSFVYQRHMGIDAGHGFIRTWKVLVYNVRRHPWFIGHPDAA